ncbi:MAG: polysaccharide biosynthesis/export family protein [Puniceicoccales bacterium]|jgi:protein involved in polysaccharide export with SLBB domain|nr:polysaccharide biosynthesis/export family protein [Puniceicoccales bacterium]
MNSFLLRTLSFTGLAIGLVFLGGCANSERPPDPPSMDVRDYKIRPSDIISVEMHREMDISAQYTVSQEGEIFLKLINRTVKVSGLTTLQITELLKNAYQKYYRNPSFLVRVLAYSPRQVWIDGFISRVGPVDFTIEQGLTLHNAILKAGGIQPRGSHTNIRLVRRETKIVDGKEVIQIKRYVINYKKIEEGTDDDIPLIEGDRITIEDSII